MEELDWYHVGDNTISGGAAMGTFKFLVGFTVGVAVGLFVGSLVAPEESELQMEARSILQEAIEEGKRAAEERRRQMEARLRAPVRE